MLCSSLKSLFDKKSSINIDLEKLPSQGLFYSDDFSISIKRAEIEDISFYEENYKNDPLSMIILIKKIVKKNIFMKDDFSFDNITSLDIIYVFFEIVKLTKGDDIWINNENESILFNSNNFNYFNIPDVLMDKYDKDNRDFTIDGFRFKLPSIGIESSVTKFINESAIKGTIGEFSDKSYDFMYFLGNKTNLTYDEVENLLIIFNDELGDSEKEIVDNIINNFSPFNRYSLKSDRGDIVEMGKMDLSQIWK